MVSKSPRRPAKPGTSHTERELPPPGLLGSPEQVIEYYSRLGLPVDPAVSIEAIIERDPNLDLVFKDLGGNDAYIKRIENDRFEIAINVKHHPNRQRFSMAHEYAHYLLHRSKIDQMPEGEKILHRNNIRNPIEYQANSFAAELLMPAELVRAAFRESGGSLKRMSDILRVSKESLRYRLSDLGYRIQ
jgi:predicted transcriptional regulator